MRFFDEASLPPDLQGARKGATEKTATIPWLDHTKLAPLPIGDGWIDVETALTLTHDVDSFRAALKRHSRAEALDHFVAELCRQLPNSEKYGMWRPIAEALGGPQTAAVLAAAMLCRNVDTMIRHGAAYALAQIGNKTSVPAMALTLIRMEEGFYRTCVHERLSVLVCRLQLSTTDYEDWTVPDEGGIEENAELRPAQSARLERAMMTGRRWDVLTFDRRIVRQPVMAPLAAGLVWGYFNDAGRLLHAFVIGPGAQYPAPPAGASVGIVHPSHFSAEDLSRWREQTSHLAATFSQWIVPAHILTAEETAGDQIPRLPAKQWPAASFLCRLEKLGWQRPRARRKLEFHTRTFADLGLTAFLQYSGIPLTFGSEWTDQSIRACYFESNRQRLPLSRVSPIAISAVLADLEALGATR